MDKLTVLGTGYALATRCYNTRFALSHGERTLLVDAGGGNGILRQMEDAQLGFETVHDFFITHAHPDHLNGAIWVLRKVMTMMKAGKYAGSLAYLLPREHPRGADGHWQADAAKKAL